MRNALQRWNAKILKINKKGVAHTMLGKAICFLQISSVFLFFVRHLHETNFNIKQK